MSITIPFPEYPDPGPPSLDSEVEINRVNTKVFIDADPISLELVPVTTAKVKGTMKATEGVKKNPEIFRLIPQSDAMPQVQTPDGIQLTPSFILMGEWNSGMARWDKFTLNGIDYQITSPIRPWHTVESRYFTKADVARV